MSEKLFDSWIKKYDQWFETPIGELVRKYELALLLKMLAPGAGENILDLGCGTGIFTDRVLDAGARVTGLDISAPMVGAAGWKLQGRPFRPLCADMTALPFPDDSFDKVYSMTAVEFIPDGRAVVSEMERVAKPGATLVLTTLNALSPWAERRTKAADQGHDLFKHVYFRSPEDVAALIGKSVTIETAVHFEKSADPREAIEIENFARGKDTGAFLAASWICP